MSRASTPRSTEALKRRAPSRCLARPSSSASVSGPREVVEGEHLAALGVLQAQEPAPRVVEVVPRLDGRPHRVEGQGPVRREVERLGLDPAEGGGAARLGPVAMRPLPGDELVAAPAVGEQGDEVPLGTARNEDRRFHSHHLGRRPLERVDGGVLPVDVVAHLRLGHGRAHRRRRHRHRVASKVDHLKSSLPSCSAHAGMSARRATPLRACAIATRDCDARRLGFRASIRGVRRRHRRV